MKEVLIEELHKEEVKETLQNNKNIFILLVIHVFLPVY